MKPNSFTSFSMEKVAYCLEKEGNNYYLYEKIVAAYVKTDKPIECYQ